LHLAALEEVACRIPNFDNENRRRCLQWSSTKAFLSLTSWHRWIHERRNTMFPTKSYRIMRLLQ
jgi:hypothetical protein